MGECIFSMSWQDAREPRKELSRYAPRLTTMKIPIDMIGSVIGPGGKSDPSDRQGYGRGNQH